jgi:hypothetical protein
MPDHADPSGTGRIEASSGRSDALPFTDLTLPAPVPATPPPAARWLAFASVLLGGGLSGMIGYGTGRLLSGGSLLWAGLGALAGALAGAIGVGIVAYLALRAMNEWQATVHPEASTTPSRGRRKDDR